MTSSPVARAGDAYGRRLGEKFGVEEVPCIVTRSLRSAELAVTEVRSDKPLGRLSDPIARQDAYMICLLLRELPNNRYWENGRQVSVASLPAGNITVHDLKREPRVLMENPVHS